MKGLDANAERASVGFFAIGKGGQQRSAKIGRRGHDGDADLLREIQVQVQIQTDLKVTVLMGFEMICRQMKTLMENSKLRVCQRR